MPSRTTEPRDPAPRLDVAGCEECHSTISRRGVLGLTASLFSAAMLPSWAEAAGDASPRLLVVLVHGGMDGLSTVVPHGDPNYSRLRGAIAIPRANTLRLNDDFGLHPALATFGSWYRAGEASIVHATCPPVRNRSHFDAQDSVESGLPGRDSNPTGWLNRMLQALPATAPVRVGGAIQIGEAPLVLRGAAPVLGWSSTWFQGADTETRRAILGVYRATDRELEAMLGRGLTADDLARRAGGGDDSGASQVQRAFRGAARLMKARGGPHVAVVSIGGFDTHVAQGGVTGELADRLRALDVALADFKREIGSLWASTAVVCATEFGRTAAVNGGRGTDHGLGTVALLAGGAIAGGKIHGEWPGLGAGDLVEGDLKPTTDLRAVFKGLLTEHLDVPPRLLARTIFPSSSSARALRGLIKSTRARPAAATEHDEIAAADGRDLGRSASPRPIPPIARWRARAG